MIERDRTVDHLLVAAARDPSSPDHDSAWNWITYEITRAVQFQGLHRSKDRAVEPVDLVQTVRIEVLRSLGDFRFQSSLRTWLQQVTLKRLIRFHRDSSAAKRSADLEPLDAAADYQGNGDNLEQQMMASVLATEIRRLLDQTGDPRYGLIFHLWVIDDRTSEEIGARIGLSSSYVRKLFQELRARLRESPQLRDWINPDAGEDESEY